MAIVVGMKRFGLVLTALFAAIALVVTACGNSQTPPAVAATIAADGSQHITVTVGSAMSFDPSAISVRAGQPVELTLTSTGGMAHDFTLKDGVGQPVKVAVGANETATGTFTIDKPGTYQFECSIPGHSLGGMKGTITAS